MLFHSETDDGRPGRRRVISENLVKKMSNVLVLPNESSAGYNGKKSEKSDTLTYDNRQFLLQN
jgi:hypothetical protein